MRAILDSGPLIAAWNVEDEHHSWAVDLFNTYAGPFYSSEPVLVEVAHLTGKDREIVQGLRARKLLLSPGMLQQMEEIEYCLTKWPHCDLADATVIALSEAYRRLDVLSTDRRHFSTYRRRDGSAVPLVLPPTGKASVRTRA
jgi:predicted nucleic acid-binding protein